MSKERCIDLLRFADENGRLDGWIAALESARRDLESAIADLTSAKLVWQPLSTVQSIGSLLLHIASTEAFWLGEDLNAEEKKYLWDDSIGELFPPAPQMPLGWYLDRIRSARARTLKRLSEISSADQVCERADSDGKTESYSLSSIFRQLLEHEAAHRGQIDMLKRWYQEMHAPVYA